MKAISGILFYFIVNICLNAQCQTSLDWEYNYEANYSPFSIEVDKLDRPFVYVAANEGGLLVLSTEGEFVSQIFAEDLIDQVKNLEQIGTKLYLVEGKHSENTAPSIQVIDILNPTDPKVLGSWTGEANGGTGGGIVKVQDNVAYLGAMAQGLILLDVSDPTNISELGSINFDVNFPFANPTESFYNSRGMDVRNKIAYVCHDAGGLHIVDCSNPELPVELGMYANPITFEPNNWPRAYNNVIVDSGLAYVAVDYCGVEILDVSDPSDVKLINHYNPHNCPVGVWWDAPIHANELVYVDYCGKLFITTGKSEFEILDVSDPMDVYACGAYGSIADTTATWGLDLRRDSIYLTYITIPIYIPLLHPFNAKGPGVKMLKWESECILDSNFDLEENHLISTFPNPSNGPIVVDAKTEWIEEITIFSSSGNKLFSDKEIFNSKTELELDLDDGLYFLQVKIESRSYTSKIVISK